MNSSNQNSATGIINLCLIILCFGLFFSFSSYMNNDKDDLTSGKSDYFQSAVVKTSPVPVDTNFFPDYNKYWTGITRCNRNYISDVLNHECAYHKVVAVKFRLLSDNYLELRLLLVEDLSYYCFFNNSQDYPSFS